MVTKTRRSLPTAPPMPPQNPQALINTRVAKRFDDIKSAGVNIYWGNIKRMDQLNSNIYYFVEYDDGDTEHVAWEELWEMIQLCKEVGQGNAKRKDSPIEKRRDVIKVKSPSKGQRGGKIGKRSRHASTASSRKSNENVNRDSSGCSLNSDNSNKKDIEGAPVPAQILTKKTTTNLPNNLPSKPEKKRSDKEILLKDIAGIPKPTSDLLCSDFESESIETPLEIRFFGDLSCVKVKLISRLAQKIKTPWNSSKIRRFYLELKGHKTDFKHQLLNRALCSVFHLWKLEDGQHYSTETLLQEYCSPLSSIFKSHGILYDIINDFRGKDQFTTIVEDIYGQPIEWWEDKFFNDLGKTPLQYMVCPPENFYWLVGGDNSNAKKELLNLCFKEVLPAWERMRLLEIGLDRLQEFFRTKDIKFDLWKDFNQNDLVLGGLIHFQEKEILSCKKLCNSIYLGWEQKFIKDLGKTDYKHIATSSKEFFGMIGGEKSDAKKIILNLCLKEVLPEWMKTHVLEEGVYSLQYVWECHDVGFDMWDDFNDDEGVMKTLEDLQQEVITPVENTAMDDNTMQMRSDSVDEEDTNRGTKRQRTDCNKTHSSQSLSLTSKSSVNGEKNCSDLEIYKTTLVKNATITKLPLITNDKTFNIEADNKNGLEDSSNHEIIGSLLNLEGRIDDHDPKDAVIITVDKQIDQDAQERNAHSDSNQSTTSSEPTKIRHFIQQDSRSMSSNSLFSYTAMEDLSVDLLLSEKMSGLPNTWVKHFNELTQFKASEGHVQVFRNPTKFPGLEEWVQKQKKYYFKMKKGQPSKMSSEKIIALESLGVSWGTDKPRREFEI